MQEKSTHQTIMKALLQAVPLIDDLNTLALEQIFERTQLISRTQPPTDIFVPYSALHLPDQGYQGLVVIEFYGQSSIFPVAVDADLQLIHGWAA